MAGRAGEGEADREELAVESWGKKTRRVVWCAPMWALREQDGETIEGGEKSGKQNVEERRERRVRLLHTVQHARENTTSLSMTTATISSFSKELFFVFVLLIIMHRFTVLRLKSQV